MQFRVLGPVEVHADDGRALSMPRRHERCVLAILLLDPGRPVSGDRLCELLWDDDPPERARPALRTYVARIRSVLNRADASRYGVTLTAASGGYQLNVPADMVDAHRFRAILDRVANIPDLDERERLLRDALALWRGPALDRAASDRLRQRLCADLDELHLYAVEESLATGLELGRDLIPELARLNAERPIRERLVELQMLALHRQGRTVEALEVYRRARTRLADELGLDPSPTLQQLHQAILRGDPLTARQPAPVRVDDGHVRPAQLPSDLPVFAGRTLELRELDALLAEAKRRTIVISAIEGTAGVGKTALAIHWAHRIRQQFPDGQLYANLRGFDPAAEPIPPGRVIRRFLDALQVAPERIPTDPDAQRDLYRSLVADKSMLIVLDNARDPDQVRPLLPGTSSCLVLVTSRNRLTGLIAIDGAQPLTLPLPSTDDARQLLASRLGDDRLGEQPDAIDDLIGLCARLPLALAVAAAQAATQPDLPLAALATQLRAARDTLDVLTGDDTATDLRAVFTCSYRALSRPAARLFRLLGPHPGPDISALAAASLAGMPSDEAQPLLTELTDANLVTEHIPGRYALHDLLRGYATRIADGDDPDERRAALRRLFDHYVHSGHAADRLLYPHRDPITLAPPAPGVSLHRLDDPEQAMAWYTAEHSVLLAAIDQAANAGFPAHTRQLAWTLTTFLYRRGHWDDWIIAQGAAVEAARTMADREGQARAQRGLGGAFTEMGRLDEATTHLQGAFDLYRELGDPTGQAYTHLNLAWVLNLRSRYREALDHSCHALDLYRATDHRAGQAHALNALGWYHAKLGDYHQAVTSCEQALALLEDLDDRPGAAAAWDSLGYAHSHLGHHDHAVTCFGHGVDLFREVGDRYCEAETLTHLGDTHHATGDTEAARTRWQQALDILEPLHHHDAENVRAKLRPTTTS